MSTHAHTHTYTRTRVYVRAHTHALECYLAFKKEWDPVSCSNMDNLEGIILSEVSQTEKTQLVSLVSGI